MKLLKDNGFSTIEALEATTRIAAQVLGLENDLGTIEEGKLADLVVVEGNPMDNIDILINKEAIHLVMQEGRLVHGK